ncbi:MAG TPA: SDR family oxidoreductase [Actinomycetes bacterium]|nr:SDR family oxidoreductase [Actinomycetes bacterium]
MNELAGKTAIVVGASRGFGRGVTEAFGAAGATVVALARDPSSLADLAARHAVHPEAADATDPNAAGKLLGRHAPDVVALIAGASPLLHPLHHHTWETFSANWDTDVRMGFNWLREALLLPLRPGSRVLVMSSGAAINGSPLSGGYAGAKATLRWIADYANQESQRAQLGIGVTAILPKLSPATDLGRPAVAAYAARAGVTEEQFRQRLGDPVTPEIAGTAFLRLATQEPATLASAYALTSAGLQPLT